MKTLSTALRNYLLGETAAYIVDMYYIQLKTGEKYYICSGDVDINYGGEVYSCSDFLIKRNNVKTDSSPTVDTMNITIYDDQQHTSKMGGKKIFPAAYEGLLDDAIITAYKAYCDPASMDMIGAIEVFNGRVSSSTVSGIQVQLTVKSEVTGLNEFLPPRIYAPQNAYYKTSTGTLTTVSTDTGISMIPLKPAARVLTRVAK